jgi:hypothetical protein
MILVSVLTVTMEEARQPPVSGERIATLLMLVGIACFLALVIQIWQTGGIWRSATRRGGFWAGAAKAAVVLGWFSAIGNIGQAFDQSNQRAASPTPLASTDKSHLDTDPNAAQPWSQVGQWVIRYDYSDGGNGIPNGCFMFRVYGDAVLRIGFYGPANDYVVMFGSDTLSPRLENQKYYNLNLKFGNELPWTVETRAIIFPGTNYKMLLFHTNQQQFFSELVSNNSLTISQVGNPVAEFSVTGAKEALQAMLTCQESHNHNPPKSF